MPYCISITLDSLLLSSLTHTMLCCVCVCVCVCVHSSKDYTTSFGAGPYEGSFTPMIHEAFDRCHVYHYCIVVGVQWF